MLKCYIIQIEPEKLTGDRKDLLEQLLPEERREKLYRLKDEKRRNCYLISSAFMQYGISKALNLPMRDIRYRYGANGKPMLAEPLSETGGGIDFSLSHSGDYAVFAISDKPVGVDIERKTDGCEAVAKRFFREEEYKDMMGADTEEERKRRFLEYWTMKEAYVKRDGRGLQIPLTSFRVIRREQGLSYAELLGSESKPVPIVFFQEQEYGISICSEADELFEENVIPCGIEDIIQHIRTDVLHKALIK